MRQINLFSTIDENQTVKAAGPRTDRNQNASRYWIAVASADHVDRGRREGFMQVCHGKANPLRRLKAGDGVIYYSPTCEFGSRASLQAFTAIGTVAGDTIEQKDMGDGFRPFRRSVNWSQSLTVPIRNILDQLEFTSGKRNWGYQFRFGLFEASEHDFRIMENVMIPAT